MNWKVMFDKCNRRKHKRFIIDLTADYALTKKIRDNEGEGVIKDISREGFSLNVCSKIAKKAHIMVQLSGGTLDTTLTLEGKIVWFENYNDFANCGLRVEWISDERIFAKYLEKLELANGIY
jgi:PilZ domain